MHGIVGKLEYFEFLGDTFVQQYTAIGWFEPLSISIQLFSVSYETWDLSY